MKIVSTYSVKIKNCNRILRDTIVKYRDAVDFLIPVCLHEWDNLKEIPQQKSRQRYIETLCHSTAKRQAAYPFDETFYKFPSYLLRASITEAIGLCASYESSLSNWESSQHGKRPSVPKAGHVFPVMYRENMYVRTEEYRARIKVWVRNTWDWQDIELKKSDVDYIHRHCGNRKECAPTLQKRGKEWYLDFPFEETVFLNDTPVRDQIALSADLGINHACTCTAMRPDGTVLGRKFLSLPREKDCLEHSINRIKKAQQHGNVRTPGLWAATKGLNDRIAVMTAQFIIDTAVFYSADVIVMEHLDTRGKKHSGKKQRLHHWRAMYVQRMVEGKAHRLGMRIAHVNAWGTSQLAYDGSGVVERGIDGNYSICRFQTGKIYNCDLNAACNIGARYFIREILREMPETARLAIGAKVPQCAMRSTCTLSTLIRLNAVLAA